MDVLTVVHQLQLAVVDGNGRYATAEANVVRRRQARGKFCATT